MRDLEVAREALGQRLRALRLNARLSGRELAAATGWPPSKISKLELGRQAPTLDDLDVWVDACYAHEFIEELRAQLATIDEFYIAWRRRANRGLDVLQDSLQRVEADTRVLRGFECVWVPGLLQTPAYAEHIMTKAARRNGISPPGPEGVRARMRRQEILYEPDRHIHLVITEAVLHYRFAPAAVMAGQLDRLAMLATLPSVRLGIVAAQTYIPVNIGHGFWIYDEDLVEVETHAAQLRLTLADEIATYRATFDALSSVARYDAEARALVTHAMETLAQR